MANYFSNAFFHKRIGKPFIASQGGPVGKNVATVKCEDFRGVLVRNNFSRKSLARVQLPWRKSLGAVVQNSPVPQARAVIVK